jgi:hypothetical protein
MRFTPLLVVIVLLAITLSGSSKRLSYMLTPNGKYAVPSEESSEWAGVTYSCLMIHASRFQRNGAERGGVGTHL